MPQPHPAEVAEFLAASARLHSALRGKVSACNDSCIVPGGDNRALLAALHAHWQEACPEAGSPYWSVRCWTLLIWQPVFLSVIGVHGAGLLPPLFALRQELDRGMVAGFRLPERGAWHRGPEPELIQSGGRSLRSLCDGLWTELNGITRLRRLSALRLVADSLLTVISLLDRIRPDVGRARMLALSSRWLQAMDLEGQSDLMPIALRDGSQSLVLNRKGCCMHYRRRDGELCATCPRQKLPVRVQRLQEELSGDAGAE